MSLLNSMDNWECNEESRYFKVSVSIKGIERMMYIKMDSDKKYWTSVYVNEYNPKFCEIKCEPCSPELWQYRIQSNKVEFEAKLNEVYNRSIYA